MSLKGREVAVVGGGIAGLASALPLRRRGASVTVHEQAPAIAEVGAGLQISPNGYTVLAALGLGAAVDAVSLPTREILFLDGPGGGRLTRLNLKPYAGRFRLIHRARLIGVLEGAARQAGVEIVLGARIDASALPEAEFVIGADGVHSALREALDPVPPPPAAGQVAWRALVPDADQDPVARVWLGPGRHLVSYPLGGGLRNIVAIEDRAADVPDGWSGLDDPEGLRAAFAGFPAEVRGWLEQAEHAPLWGLKRYRIARRWHGGNIVLAGDAAHATLPYMAQGANLALEDAWGLGLCLGARGGAARYQALRAGRVARAIAAANGNAKGYHLKGAARVAAGLILRASDRLAPGAALARFGWLYGHDVTRGGGPGA